MKQYAVIPVMFDQNGETAMRASTPSKNILSEFFVEEFVDGKFKPGAVILEALLNSGWKIISVQSSSISASTAVAKGGGAADTGLSYGDIKNEVYGEAVFVYILESPEME